jgi:PmbA protein
VSAGGKITIDRLAALAAAAIRAGADAADAIFVNGRSLSLSQRLGKRQNLQRSEGEDLGLRVFIGKRQAVVSSSDTCQSALDELTARAVAMAKSVPEDPYCGLAEPEQLARDLPELDLLDQVEPSAEDLSARAAEAEEAALAVPGVTNSEGADAGWHRITVNMAASNGFSGTYSRSSHSVSASVLAGSGTAMERDYDYATAVHLEDLRGAREIGRQAGTRAVRRLSPRKAKSSTSPVVFDPRVAGGMVGHLASAINGAAVARGTSFLKDKMGEAIFPEAITIIDDPRRRRGLKSRPFDGEGLAAEKRRIIDHGRLTTWFMDLRSARQLGLKSTGHASRGVSGPPSPAATNLYLEAGKVTREELMADIESGLYVTEMIGFGINQVTGDYSRGASGFWIEDGVIAYPVSEVTIAGNLNHMFANIHAADDLEFRFATDAPTLRIDGMTIAGK